MSKRGQSAVNAKNVSEGVLEVRRVSCDEAVAVLSHRVKTEQNAEQCHGHFLSINREVM